MEKKPICYIAGAGKWNGESFVPRDGDCVIAADGGYRYLLERGIRVDLVMGDFDSSERPDIRNVKVYPREKDETDLYIAVREGFERGYRRFVIYGGLDGERFDHTLGNLQIVVRLAKEGATACLVDGKTTITAVHNGTLILPPQLRGYVSVFSFSNEARGVSLRGFKYELVNHTLYNDFPLGVSNEFTGHTGYIEVKDGTLLVVIESKTGGVVLL